MNPIFSPYLSRLARNGLIDDGQALLGLADAEVEWSAPDHPDRSALSPLFDSLPINALIFARPAEPYRTIMDYLAKTSVGPITPNDCETRTFLHDLPVAESLTAEALIPLLKQRKCAIVENHGIVACGTVSLEQPLVTISSACFACFVKFFSDFLAARTSGNPSREQQAVFETIAARLPDPVKAKPYSLAQGPFLSDADARAAICEAGAQVVNLGLVDSFFGNISYLANSILHISQTGAFLDDLADTIDPVPLNGSSCAGITASSELSAHLAILRQTGRRAILHGHPKFSVIMSMQCDRPDCPDQGNCHRCCPHERFVCDVPVVSGEVGTGPHGLCRTVPPAFSGHSGVIVYGHGVFTIGDADFNDALDNLIDIERRCRLGITKILKYHIRNNDNVI